MLKHALDAMFIGFKDVHLLKLLGEFACDVLFYVFG